MNLEKPEQGKKHLDAHHNNLLDIALMGEMLGVENLNTENESAWILKYGKEVREIIEREEQEEIRRLLNEEKYNEAATLVIEILKKEDKL